MTFERGAQIAEYLQHGSGLRAQSSGLDYEARTLEPVAGSLNYLPCDWQGDNQFCSFRKPGTQRVPLCPPSALSSVEAPASPYCLHPSE